MSNDWTFDERANAGDEHLDPAEVARFDEKSPFDPDPDVEALLERGLSAEDTVVEFGAGTGVFALAVAPHCDRVVAADVSPAMLDVARAKLDDADVENVDLVTAGFLGYKHTGDLASVAFSKDALHHLPDFWKVEALETIGATLEPGGVFRLSDFVVSFPLGDCVQRIASWIAEKRETTSFSAEEIHTHFRDEYSTYGFLLESMLERTGFEILEAEYRDGLYATYTCEWQGDDE